MVTRRPPWQVREELRGLFLRCYDHDLGFQRSLRQLAKRAAPLELPGHVAFDHLAAWAMAVLPAERAGAVVDYCSAVRGLATDVGLAGLEPMPGIMNSGGPGLVHAWCTTRPDPRARFSRSPFTRGGIEPPLTLRTEARHSDMRETLADVEYRFLSAATSEVRRWRRAWQTGTQVTRRRFAARDATFLFQRVRHRRPWSEIGDEVPEVELGPDEIRKAARRFAEDIGLWPDS